MVDDTQYQATVQRLTNQLNGLQQSLQEQERNFQYQISNLRSEHSSELSNLQSRLQANIRSVEEALKQQIKESERRFQQALKQIQDDIKTKESNQKTIAKKVRQQAESILQSIEKKDLLHFDHQNQQQLLVGEISNVQLYLDLAPEAAISIANNVFLLGKLHEQNLLYLKSEWDVARLEVQAIYDELSTLYKHLLNVNLLYKMLDSSELTYKVDVNYWLEGKLTEDERIMKQVENDLNKPYIQIKTLRYHLNSLQQLLAQANTYESTSKERTRQSIEKFELAVELKTELKNRTFLNYVPTQSGYLDLLGQTEQEPFQLGRSDYRLTFIDPKGEKIEIIFSNQGISYRFESKHQPDEQKNEENKNYFTSLLDRVLTKAKRNLINSKVERENKPKPNVIINLKERK
jgi:hypothetical protein